MCRIIFECLDFLRCFCKGKSVQTAPASACVIFWPVCSTKTFIFHKLEGVYAEKNVFIFYFIT